MATHLSAKSWDEKNNGPAPPFVFLPEHLQDVHSAAEQVLRCTGDDQLTAFQLVPGEWRERLRRVVLLAAALHDLGKANDHFQGMVTWHPSRRDRPQGLRHEWVTWLLLQRPAFRDWLLPALDSGPDREAEWLCVQWAVTGHHPAFGRASPPTEAPDGCGREMKLLLGQGDFARILDWLATTFRLSAASRVAARDEVIPLAGLRSVFTTIKQTVSRHASQWAEWQSSPAKDRRDWIAFVAAVKNTLVAADVAGSALPKDVSAARRDDWIRNAFARVPTPEQLRDIVTLRLTDPETGAIGELRPFQRAVAEQAAEVTFVRAGCGSGKTLAAYHWASERCPGRRLYLCYPTTGTATEGFRDYLFEPEARHPRFGADLFHGRADVDLELILHVAEAAEGSSRDAAGADDELADEARQRERIESLDAWSTPIVACTVDMVLGVIQNNRRGLYSWPAFAHSAFVFDEIHAYDDKLFGALLRFLASLPGLTVLLMTASLPTWRLALLEETVRRRGTRLAVIAGPADLEERPRYHWQGCVDTRGPLPEVQAELQQTDRPGQVLWVCNTVDRCIAAADRAVSAGLRPLVYHSRFVYADRVRQHAAVIDAFKSKEPTLAICTQVAEMSLDLSATLLVTELAPVPALIQRLGRLNRRAAPGSATCLVRVIEPLNDKGERASLPYTKEELALAERWLAVLPAAEISQRHLAEAWEQLDAPTEHEAPDWSSVWLDGGPVTLMKELRQSSPGLTVIRESDRRAHEASPRDQRVPLAQRLLPMPDPKPLSWKSWPKYRGIPVAPDATIEYSQERGARWKK